MAQSCVGVQPGRHFFDEQMVPGAQSLSPRHSTHFSEFGSQNGLPGMFVQSAAEVHPAVHVSVTGSQDVPGTQGLSVAVHSTQSPDTGSHTSPPGSPTQSPLPVHAGIPELEDDATVVVAELVVAVEVDATDVEDEPAPPVFVPP